jgi:hypothetical protein
MASGARARDSASRSKEAAIFLGRGHRLVRSDGCEASACDAKRDRSAIVIASPDRERTTRPNLFQQAGADQLIDDLSGGFALNIRRSSTPRSSRCEAADRMMSCVSVSLAIGILRCLGSASFAPPPQPHLGPAAGGAGSRSAPGARNGHSTALFAEKCQSFLDNPIAGLRQIGAWDDRRPPSGLPIDHKHFGVFQLAGATK